MGGIDLETPLSELPWIAQGFLRRLKKLGLLTVRDLLWHFPARYEDFSEIYKISDLAPGQLATIRGEVVEIQTKQAWRRRMTIVEALIEDESGSIKAIWFNQPYIVQMLKPGRVANFSGKVAVTHSELYLRHPTYEFTDSRRRTETKHTARLVPIYPETKGLTSKGLRFLIQPILERMAEPDEWLPEETLARLKLPRIETALTSIHFPAKLGDALDARKRFASESLLLLQIQNLRQKIALANQKAPVIKADFEKLKEALKTLPFELTFSQKRSLWEILKDFEKPTPMNRLLQGDVGSGKTVVAALAALVAIKNDYQVAVMAPTEVLAHQHFETFKKLFARIGARRAPIALFTGSAAKIVYDDGLESAVKKNALAEKTASGEIKILIGTHALISGKGKAAIGFKALGFVVIDEQHRFGVAQRKALARRQTQTEAQTDAEGPDNFLYEQSTYAIRKCLFEVRKKIGLGHKEKIYQNALQEEFKNSDVDFEKEKSIPVTYNGKNIGVYRPDFLINGQIILELKSLPFVGPIEKKQLWNYLRGSNYRLALLANFGQEKLTIDRIAYDTARKIPPLSASSPRLLASSPHFLSMSATPIPRTLTLTIFGDLDVSLITELPAGRKNITTNIVPPEERGASYEFIRSEVRSGRQVFVICPRIEPQTGADKTPTAADNTRTDAGQAQNYAEISPRLSSSVPQLSASSPRLSASLEVKSVKQEYQKLSEKVFPDLTIAMLHGQLKTKEKHEVMKAFKEGKTDVLVSTSVVEVGVDVPNATVMMIEGAERFGLAQLYQFRGRVGRAGHQSHCFLFTESGSRDTTARLAALVEAKNGFELAEKDLSIRGPGEFLGEEQTGFSDTAMAGLQDLKLVIAARQEAAALLETDPELKKHPLLKERADAFGKKIHLE